MNSLIISAGNLTGNSVQLSTTTAKPTDATKIIWYKKLSSDQYWTITPIEVLLTDPNWSTTTFNNLADGIWQFKARFANDTVQSVDSNRLDIDFTTDIYTLNYTVVDDDAPTQPPNFVGQAVSNSRIDVSWDASIDNILVTGYNLYIDNGTAIVKGVNERTHSFTNLTTNTLHKIEVEAFDAAGNKSQKNTINVNTTTDTTAPTAPTQLSGTAFQGRIDLTFTPGTDNVGVAFNNVYRDGVKIGNTSTSTYSDTTIQPDITYNYQVTSVDSAGNESVKSGSIPVRSLTATDTTPPSAGIINAVAISSSQVDGSFTAPTDNVGVTKQELYRNNTKIQTWNDGLAHTFSDISLTPVTQFNYQVIVYDAAGNSKQSNTVTVTTLTSGGGTTTTGQGLTLADAISEVQSRLAIGTDQTQITDAEITKWFNFALKDISDNLNIEATYTGTTLADETSYDLPKKFVGLYGGVRLDDVKQNLVEPDDGRTGYYLFNNKIYFQGTTITTGMTIDYKYYRRSNDLVNDTDYIDLPEQYQEIIIIYAVARGFYKLQMKREGDDAMSEYTSKKLEAIGEANRNQTDEPLTIRTYY